MRVRQFSVSRGLAVSGVAALLIPVFIVAAAAWPGFYNVDSLKQLRQAMTGQYADNHPPLMALLWSGLLGLTGTPASMFGLQIALLAIGLLLWAFVLWRAQRPEGLLFLLLAAFSPTVLFLPGVILKDVGFALSLSIAFALVAVLMLFPKPSPVLLVAAIILAFYATGVRWNGLPAVIPLLYLAALTVTPLWARPKHLVAGMICVLCSIVLLSVNLIVVYRVLATERDHLVQFLQIYDLAGIAVRTGQSLIPNEFRTDRFSDAELKKAYNVSSLDLLYVTPAYLFREAPTVENVEKLFGREAVGDGIVRVRKDNASLTVLSKEWLNAIWTYPGAYLDHKIAVFASLLRLGYHPYAAQIPATLKLRYPDWAGGRISTAVLTNLIGWARSTPLFTGWFWIIILLGGVIGGIVVRDDPLGKVTIALGLSGLANIIPYFLLGAATDFRYCYWSVVAATLCLVLLGAFGTRTLRDIVKRRLP